MNKKLFFIVDRTTSGGQCVGEGFFVGTSMDALIRSIQQHYINSCAEFNFCVYIAKLNEPIYPSLKHGETNFDFDKPCVKVQLGTREVWNMLDNSYNDNHICFPIVEECDMMQELPKNLFLCYNDSNWTVFDDRYKVDYAYFAYELTPINSESSVFYCNNY